MLQTLARWVRPNLRSGDRACRFNESEANRLPGIFLVRLNKARHHSSRITVTALTADWQERQKLVVHHLRKTTEFPIFSFAFSYLRSASFGLSRAFNVARVDKSS
jgi:hypothetical protein